MGRSDSTVQVTARHREVLATPTLPASASHPGLLMTVEQVAVPSFEEVDHGGLATGCLVTRADVLFRAEKC